MYVSSITFELAFQGAESLREKQRRVSRWLREAGRNPSVAVCESDHSEEPTRGAWTCLVVSRNPKSRDQLLSRLESDLASQVDGRVTDVITEHL